MHSLQENESSAERIAPLQDDDPTDPNFDAKAAHRAYLRSVASPISPGQYQEFRQTEISVCAALLQGDSRRMKRFQSLLSSIPNTFQPIQIIHFFYKTAKFLKLESD